MGPASAHRADPLIFARRAKITQADIALRVCCVESLPDTQNPINVELAMATATTAQSQASRSTLWAAASAMSSLVHGRCYGCWERQARRGA